MKVGILSLQGSFFDHQKSLDLISLDSLLIKTPEDLDKVDGIILPGGESTATVSYTHLTLPTIAIV